MFKVGDRVKYDNGRFSASRMNPLVGSEWECAGTVDRILGVGNSASIGVLWDNNTHNSYGVRDLTHVNSTDPNWLFREKKLRRKHG